VTGGGATGGVKGGLIPQKKGATAENRGYPYKKEG